MILLLFFLFLCQSCFSQIFSVNDVITLVEKQQQNFGTVKKSDKKINLFVPLNDYVSREIPYWEHVYNVIVIPPPWTFSYAINDDESETQMFLGTPTSQIHFSLLCSEGVPLLQEGDQPKKCDPNSVKSDCPTGFWCHVGNTPATFFCCPSNRKIPNLCHLPPNSGFGSDKINRYWYDWRSGYCREMVYSGFGGNENNFVARDTCEKRCAGTPKPSSSTALPSDKKSTVDIKAHKSLPIKSTIKSPPRLSPPLSTTTIKPLSKSTLTLHRIRSTTTTTSTSKPPPSTNILPEKVTNPCNLPPDKGEKASPTDSTIIFRWYFDMVAERCVQFYFLGTKGNSNNFEHEDSCLETCGGGPTEQSSCKFLMEPGFGDYLIPRYYFSEKSKSCRKFTYKGYGGNHNRFTSRSTCEKVCIKKTMHSHARKPLHPTNALPLTTVSPSVTSISPSTTVPPATSRSPFLHPYNPLSLTPEIVQSIFDLNKYTNGPDPFELPKGLKPAKPNSPTLSTTLSSSRPSTTTPSTTEDDSEEEDPFEIPDNEITELTPDPFDPKQNASHKVPTKATFPLAKFPSLSGSNTTTTSDEEDDSDEYDTFTDMSKQPIIVNNPLTTTTPTNQNFPTLVSIIDNFSSEPQQQLPNNGLYMFTTTAPTAASPFQQQFKKYSTTPSPQSSIDHNNLGKFINGTYPMSNFQNILKLVNANTLQANQQPKTFSTHPCLISLSDKHLIQSCRPEGTFPARGSVWSQICPDGSFCQVAESIQQSVCCPKFGVDACVQIKASGIGTSSLQRWYFDAISKQCRGFIFKGYQGNQNNFLTYEACRRQCQAINPCDYGTPYGFESIEGSKRCIPTASSTCPPQYYCHESLSDAVCCPLFNGTITSNTSDQHGSPLTGSRQGSRKFASPCSLSILPGSGGMNLNRWAYDVTKKKCITFVYKGTGGNQNNFLTKADCVNTCVATFNPCSSGSPLIEGSKVFQCSATIPCPTGYYCNSGGTSQTNVCCPSTGISPCLLSLSTGTGSAFLHRYYFDSVTSSCKAFTYTGIGGNENNFLTVKDCRKACPEYDNPCSVGKPYTNPSDGSVTFCSSANPTCPQNHFCHIGDSRPTTVCCPSVGHQCSSKVLIGIGKNQLPRYYYNHKTRTCVPFVYSGKGGNANNFVSKTECEIACPVLDNPCVNGFPALDSYGEPEYCSIANQNVCPAGYFCHIGNTQTTTLCCPGAGDSCSLPMSKGTGASVLNRWYFNTESKVCVSFVYSGRGGNSNNFISRQQCLAACPEYASPCPQGQPHIGLSGQITHCGATDPSICPTTYWCHVGATLEASVCCPGAADPCDQEISKGSGTAQLLRYYYNQLSRTCNQFRYSGLNGNENNFLTKAACEARCPVFVSPCAAGAPEMDESLTPIPCSAADNSTCSAGFWCHIGATEQTTICCSGATTSICEEPRISGSGDASLPRYYFNPLTKQCLPFIYHGSGGNQNNFLSRAACEGSCAVLQNPCAAGEPATGANGLYVTCSSNSPNVCPANYWCHIGADVTEAICCPGAENPCSLSSAAGDGTAALTRWYFDANLRRCAKFTYSGIAGNQNNFLTLQECQLKCPEFESPCATGDPAQAPSGGILFCSSTEQTCPRSYFCHIGATAESTVCCPNAGDPCLSSMQPGTGNSKLSRWYFNQNTRQCLEFTYSGSGGNGNNFVSEMDCAAKCPVFKNPCPNSAASNQLTVIRCSAQNMQNCPAGFWCHLGGTSDTSVCCPGASDPCRLPVSQGTDNNVGPYTRWYYDFTARVCEQFQYSGFHGNENNFLTKEDCAQRCPEFVNPCFTGEPLVNELTRSVRFCSHPRSPGCPKNYYCHMGASSDGTVCCPNSRDVCSQALATGTGSHSIPRWYFNSQSRQCQEFIYSGLQGNANNFVSRAACSQACPEFSNPCGDGQPLTSIGGQVTYCSPQNKFICPNGYYCHVGSGADSTVCCPGPTNPCSLSMEVGRGSSSLPRYYFNQFTRQCQQFIYSGRSGNANNFLSLEACRQACPEFNNPCTGGGMPFQPNHRAVFHCDSSTPCPHDYFCHYGIDSITTVCCPIISEAPPCQLPAQIGTGQSSVTRYYYNSQIGQCIPFIYSGLGGNQNNFVSMHDCINECSMTQPYLSSAAATSYNGGNGLPSQPLYIRSPFGSRMHKFEKPEHENFEHFNIQNPQVMMRKICPQGQALITPNGDPVTCNIHDINPCPHPDYVCNLNQAGEAFCCPDPKSFCLKPPSPGNCQMQAIPAMKFGYNPFTDTCQQFTFTNCGESINLNNFNSLTECSNICCNKGYNLLLKFNDDFDAEKSAVEKRWKDALPLFGSSDSRSEEERNEETVDSMITEFMDSSTSVSTSKDLKKQISTYT